MKKLWILIFCLILFSLQLEALTYKPLYPGESKCYHFLIKDQKGVAIVPAAGDVVTMTLKRTPNSSSDLLTATGVYNDDNSDYNFSFSVDSDDTGSLAVGDAYWYLELTNSTNKIHVVIDVSKIVVKK